MKQLIKGKEPKLIFFKDLIDSIYVSLHEGTFLIAFESILLQFSSTESEVFYGFNALAAAGLIVYYIWFFKHYRKILKEIEDTQDQDILEKKAK